MNIRTVEKVTAFITRLNDRHHELLIIEHPLAGLQVPAGTVEIDESIENAVIREVGEESGLAKTEIVVYLGSTETMLMRDDHIILRMTKLFSTPEFDSSSEGYILGRGLPVRVTKQVGKFSGVICDPLDPHQQPPKRRHGVTGYVRTSLLGKRIIRHMFQLKSTTDTPDEWQHHADGHLFKLHWVKIDPPPVLNPIQSDWLDSIKESLIFIDPPDESVKD